MHYSYLPGPEKKLDMTAETQVDSSFREQFLLFAIEQDVLRFGEFTLKSGRKSPYFFNAGLFNTGGAMARLGEFYAQAIVDSGVEFDMLFGPAYKGIPLVTVTAAALAGMFGRDVPLAFNRKEAKDHGEGGNTVGAPVDGKVLIIDDVITAGVAVREAITLIRETGAEPVGLTVALDRQERGPDGRSAIESLEDEFGLAVISIARLDDLIGLLQENETLVTFLPQLREYRAEYGV